MCMICKLKLRPMQKADIHFLTKLFFLLEITSNATIVVFMVIYLASYKRIFHQIKPFRGTIYFRKDNIPHNFKLY